jgi:G3E family GTPase
VVVVVVPHRSAAETDGAYARRAPATTTASDEADDDHDEDEHGKMMMREKEQKEGGDHHQHQHQHQHHRGVKSVMRQAEAQVRAEQLERKRVALQCRDAQMYADLAGDLRALDSRQSEETLEIMEEFRLLREGQAASRRASETLARELEGLTLEVAKCHAKTDRVTSLLETLLERFAAVASVARQ